MNVKLSVLFSAYCLIGIGSVCAPVRADDDASNAVKQCFQNMQSVHSYRVKTVDITPGYDEGDQNTVTENTQTPRRSHQIITFAASKTKFEGIISDNISYDRTNDGPWQTTVLTELSSAPWNSSWSNEYDPHATYVFTRKDTLDSIPVIVYSTSGLWDKKQTDTEIWIGVKDHLPHEILRHSIQDDHKFEHYITETLSDFNAPITITVPDVAPSDPSAVPAQPSGSQ